MTIGSSFREIADVLDEFDESGFEIVEPRSRDREGSVAVEFGAIIPVLEGIGAREAVDVSVQSASIDADGRVVLDVSVSTPVDMTAGSDGATGPGASDEARPELDAPAGDEERAPQSDRGGRGNSDGVSDADERGAAVNADGREEGDRTPAHRDPEKLRAAYDAHDTFADMTEALGVDVTPQTVRRQMIEHGIHEPGTASDDDPGSDEEKSAPGTDDTLEPRDESGDEDVSGSERTATLADGIDIPAGTDLEELNAAVRTSRTVHEVGRALGTDRERTRRLLGELDLLELVTGRLSAEREASAEEIDRRIERSAPGSA